MTDHPEDGITMHKWAKDLYPLRRSLSGAGVRQTLSYLQELMPGLSTHAISSGRQVFDWTVPDEWDLRDAYIEDPSGTRVVDLADHGLHVVGYSTAVDETMDLQELQTHLYSLEDQPDAIPYVTSYYERRWGFCLSHRKRLTLQPGRYRVRIDATLGPGVLNYADLILPGKSSSEVLFSTYVCHPMMANNEVSGPVVTTALARWLMGRGHYYTYRFVFIPETIGSLIYLSRHLDHLKKNVVAGYVLTCIGDDREFSFLPSREGDTLADRVGREAARQMDPNFRCYSFLDRGSDERQYCSPLADLPVASLMRSKYGEYPEYHTSLDDLSLVTPEGLEGGLSLAKTAVSLLEENFIYRATQVGEPQLGKRGLYSTISSRSSTRNPYIDFLAYADGKNDLLKISELTRTTASECAVIGRQLLEHNLVERWRSI